MKDIITTAVVSAVCLGSFPYSLKFFFNCGHIPPSVKAINNRVDTAMVIPKLPFDILNSKLLSLKYRNIMGYTADSRVIFTQYFVSARITLEPNINPNHGMAAFTISATDGLMNTEVIYNTPILFITYLLTTERGCLTY